MKFVRTFPSVMLVLLMVPVIFSLMICTENQLLRRLAKVVFWAPSPPKTVYWWSASWMT